MSRCTRLIVALVTILSLVPAMAHGATPSIAAPGNASLNLSKTVDSASINPTMGLSLAVNHQTAIPGDGLTYTATVTNTGATLTMHGTYVAQNGGDIAATIVSYADNVEYYSKPKKQWLPLAGMTASQAGYTPLSPLSTASGMTVSVTSTPASGVTYPSSGDPILGTQLATSSTAVWNYTATASLTTSQVSLLATPAGIGSLRNVVHMEVSPRDIQNGQPSISRAEFTNPFQSTSAAISDITITVAPPSGGAVAFSASTTPALASLAPGASTSVSTTYTVPPIAGKDPSANDADYLAGLATVNGSTLAAKATADGSGASGSLSADPAHATTTEYVPMLTIVKSGPPSADAGTTQTYPLALTNTGGAVASALAIADSLPDGSHGTVTGPPGSLGPGASASATADYAVSSDQVAGPLTDTASVTWHDANRNQYGPVSSSWSTTITNRYSGATVALTPQSAGPDVTGTEQDLRATVLDSSGSPIPNAPVSFAIAGPNATTRSATTNASGIATLQYSGTIKGTDTVQATVANGSMSLQSNTSSVSWVTPIAAVSTTSIVGKFFPNGGGAFSHTPADTPAFTQSFPTIDFNPPAGTILNTPPSYSVNVNTRPFTDVTTDLLSDYSGQIVAQGNGVQAGVGSLFSFDAVFTATFVVAKAGDIQFNFYSDDGFIFGVAGGATAVAGANTVNYNTPSVTPFEGYPVMGGYDDPTSPRATPVTVHFPAPGEYAYEVDYSECCGGQLALTVANNSGGKGVAPAGTLALTPVTPATQTVGQPVTLTVQAVDTSGLPIANLPVTLSVSAGPNAQPPITRVTDAKGLATLPYTGTAAGTDQVQVAANVNGMPAISNLVQVTWQYPAGAGGSGGTACTSSCPAPPTVADVSPSDGAIVTKPIPITASFTPPSGATITAWSVTYQAQDPEPAVTLASGTGTPPSTLTTFDPTLLANDTYVITVSATASTGGTQSVATTVAVSGNLKLGRYLTTYQDLTVPVAGFQMQVQRTYDSYDHRVGDFGYGWHVSVSNFRTSSNRILGAGGWTMYDTSCFAICLTAFRSTTPHFVTVTWPDGHQEIFDFTPSGGSNLLPAGGVAFTARPGTDTTSTLSVPNPGDLAYLFDGNLYDGFGGPIFNPQRFQLTTRDGRVFILDVKTGLVSETDRAGNSLTVDASGVHASSGQSISFTRDSQNRITDVTGPSGEHLSYGYDPTTGDLTAVTNANGTVNYAYSNHLLQSVTGPGSTPLVTLSYTSDGRLQSVQQGSNAPETISDNVGAQTQTSTDPMGKRTTVDTFDDQGDLIQEDQTYTDPSSGQPKTLTTKWTYNANGQPLSRQDPLGHTISAQYDPVSGDLTQFTDADNHVTDFAYNGYGQPTAITAQTPAGTVPLANMVYDGSGNLTELDRPDGSKYLYGYDASGNVTSITDPLKRVSQFWYDADGHLKQAQDPAGDTTSYSIDAAGHVLSTKDANGNTTSFQYDGDGNLTDIYDAKTNHRHYTYNALDQLTQATDALGRSDAYAYTATGQLDHVTDRNGNRIQYGYDGDGRLHTVTLPNQDVTTYNYDPLGRLTEADNASAKDQFSYDDAGRLTSQTSSGTSAASQPTVTLNYGYDAAGNRTSLSGPDGTTGYHYDELARLDTITDPSNGKFTFGYDALSRLTSITRPNNVNDTLTYDAADDLQSRIASLNGTQVTEAAYGYDPNGLRSSLATLSNQVSYQHDAIGQLTSATYTTNPPANESYQYDAVGNRIASASQALNSLSYDANDRLTSDPAFSYQYDNEGDLVQKTNLATNAVTKYQWNARHQLLEIDYSDGTKTSYRYDPLGRRVEINDNGTITRYVYDGQNIHLEYGGANTLSASYLDDGTMDGHLEMVRGGQPYYYLQDGLGSVSALTDSSGNLVDSYTYDAFGNLSSSGSVANPFTYTGREYDTKSGLYYYRARYYDSGTGSFLGEDPLQALNPYPYTSSDPVDLVDATGMADTGEYATLSRVLAALGATGGAFGTAVGGDLSETADGLPGAFVNAFTGPITRVTLSRPLYAVRFFPDVSRFYRPWWATQSTLQLVARQALTQGISISQAANNVLALGQYNNPATQFAVRLINPGVRVFVGEIANGEPEGGIQIFIDGQVGPDTFTSIPGFP